MSSREDRKRFERNISLKNLAEEIRMSICKVDPTLIPIPFIHPAVDFIGIPAAYAALTSALEALVNG